MTIRTLLLPCALGLTIAFGSCKHKPQEIPNTSPDDSGYPKAVADIIVTRCATAGCHNAASYTGAGGLRLDKWEHMFEGGNNGSAVVAYSPNFSPLLYFINTDTSLGPVAQPTMPVNGIPLTRQEYLTIRDWIANGAPNKDGAVPFGDDAATRQKVYLTMQPCDQVAVIDAETRLVMRYIAVGNDPAASEGPHNIRFTKDGKYAFVCFFSGQYIQKIDATTDKVIQTMNIATNSSTIGGVWNIIYPSNDGSKALVSDWRSSGNVTLADFTTGTTYNKGLVSPHGIAPLNDSFRQFYVTGQIGNGMYRITMDPKNPFIRDKEISLDGNTPNYVISSLNPHDLVLSPDGSKAFVTCEVSNDIRVVDTKTDSLIKGLPNIIPVGTTPQELAISRKAPYLFITCMTDKRRTLGNITFEGTVYVINYNTHQVVKVIEGNFANPHGITVDDDKGLVYIASRNILSVGPLPHHTSVCAGKNGYYNVYDLYTLEPATTKRYEVIPEPYSFDTRFKY